MKEIFFACIAMASMLIACKDKDVVAEPLAIRDITITNNGLGFTPGNVEIGVGSTVTWNINMATHPLRSGTSGKPTNLFLSNTGTSFAYTFKQAGTYSYHCTVHGDEGTIVIK